MQVYELDGGASLKRRCCLVRQEASRQGRCHPRLVRNPPAATENGHRSSATATVIGQLPITGGFDARTLARWRKICRWGL